MPVPTTQAAVDFLFQNRAEAGKQLAEALSDLKGRDDVVVIGVPRGGVVVASEVAAGLGAPLDIWVSAKLELPGTTGSIGYVSEDGDRFVDEAAVARARIQPAVLVSELHRQRQDVRRRAALYRGDYPALDLHEKIVVVVDDGLATGATVRPVLLAVARSRPARCILALPVAAIQPLENMADLVNERVALATPPGFRSVADYYMHFMQVRDADVIQCVKARRGEVDEPKGGKPLFDLQPGDSLDGMEMFFRSVHENHPPSDRTGNH